MTLVSQFIFFLILLLQPIVISKSRLNKFFNLSELPIEIGGLQHYNHDEWIRNRIVSIEFQVFSPLTIIICLISSHSSILLSIHTAN